MRFMVDLEFGVPLWGRKLVKIDECASLYAAQELPCMQRGIYMYKRILQMVKCPLLPVLKSRT